MGDVDSFYLLVVGCLVFFMQAGFGMLEAGTVRAKNTKNILLKNMLDACIGAMIWWSFGYGIAYSGGDNGFIGTAGIEGAGGSFFAKGWYGTSEDVTGYTFAGWWFQYGFAAAAATIVSGAVAERCALPAYLIYTCVITGFIYPVVVHWVWATGGFVSAFTPKGDTYPVCGGVVDFAGSGVVHMTGGLAAFCGASVLGPRTGRYGEDGKPVPMPGHSTTLSVLGTFILWLGWYGFNPGSTLAITGYGMTMSRVAVCTTVAAAMGGITTLLIDKMIGSKVWDVSAVCNGVLGGLVSITAGCATISTWYSAVVGMLGGFVYFGASKLLSTKLKVDDPLDAFAVHGACGFWGVIATALFASPVYTDGIFGGRGYGSVNEDGVYDADGYSSAFFGGGKMLGSACVALFATIAWVCTLSLPMFFVMKKIGIFRVSAEIEEAGMDTSKHGGSAYS